MIYFKSVLVGIATAVIASVLWLLAEIGLQLIVLTRQVSREAGSGGIGAVSAVSFVPIGAFLGFVLGFMWSVRRLRRKQRTYR